MYYKSLQHKAPKVSFKEAVIRGIAPDKGLYFPESITPLPPSFFENITSLSNESIALEVIQQFIGNDIPIEELKKLYQKHCHLTSLRLKLKKVSMPWNFFTVLLWLLRM